jgi:hypothetical protein
MQNQLINKTATPIDPIKDTWELRKSTGKWFIVLPFDFSSLSIQEVNDWYINTITKMLDAFSQLARVWQVCFHSSYKSEIKGVVLEWQPENSYEEYIENVLQRIKEYPAPIEEAAMQVDLFVFVRTQESPNKPIRAWVRSPSELLIDGGLEYGEPDLGFSVAHTLFRPSSFYGIDNSELYSLNQPLLENALRSLAERFGSISEVEGLPRIYEYGFLPYEDKDK